MTKTISIDLQEQQQQELLCSINSNHQELLSSALQKKNINYFRRALLLDNANPELLDEKLNLSIFEKCCQTPGHAEFIRECLLWGCDVNKINEAFNKTPINFVVESEDADNISALLEDPTIHIDKTYEDLTPLHLLATNINDDNYTKLFKCMKKLIDRQANVNIPNRRNVPPVLTIAKNRNLSREQKETLIQYFLEYSAVDLDIHRNGEARKYLTKEFPDLVLPVEMNQEKRWDFTNLMATLKDEDELEFLYGFDSFLATTPDADNRNNLFRERSANETLLTVAARNGMVRAVEKLLRAGADVNNYKAERSGKLEPEIPPIEAACIYGNWQVLQLFLRSPNIDVHQAPILIRVIKNIGDDVVDNRTCDFRKCFDLLLNHQGIDINQKDKFGNTALHTAVKYNNKSAILALLNRGAYLGTQNKFNDFSITDIDPKILEKHFNNCITTNDRRSGDDNYEIRFNYSNLVPARSRKSCATAPTQSKSSPKFPTKIKHSDEMAPIEYIAKSSELKHLVKHPLIASFLFLKWHRLATVFYTNFLCYSIYCMAIITYLLFCYGQEDASKGLAGFLYAVSAVGGIYVFCRETAQLIMSPREYLRNKENFLEIALIAMTIVVLASQNYTESTRRTVAAFTILLAVGEFFLLTGSLPILSFSTHLVMLKTVSKSFLRGLLLYSIILIAFALSFYTLLGEDPPPKTLPEIKTGNLTTANENDGEGEEEEEDEFNKFGHPGISILKTVVMLTGEFDASDINFKHNISSYFIFVVFVFLISTVLFNLLNGLAVSDTQAIKAEAELTHFIYRAELMARYEKIMLGKGDSECCNFVIGNWSSNLMCLFPEFLPRNLITVLPNQNNHVLIPINNAEVARKKEFSAYDIEDDRSAAVNKLNGNECRDLECELTSLGCCVGNRCSRMEPKIMKYAKAVLEQKLDAANGSDIDGAIDMHEINQRIIKIEKNINQIFAKMDLVLATLNAASSPIRKISS